MAEELKKVISSPELQDDIDTLAKYDPEMRFRRLTGVTAKLVFVMTIVLSIFHIYTAGFGVLQEWRHRAFHLAFVLPLVFFVYSMKKEVHRKGGKHLLYDVLYAGCAAMLNTAVFREIFGLSFAPAAAVAIGTFGFSLYFKQRENLPDSLSGRVDFPIHTAMIAFILCGAGFGWTHLDVRSWFVDLNPSLIFWGVFLLGVFIAITALFFLQWGLSLYGLIRHGRIDYKSDNVPYFDLFLALMSCMISVYVFLEFNNIGMRAGSPDFAELVVGSFSFLLILEAARRSIGAPLPIIAMLVLINCYLGPYFLDIPGLDIFAHRGYSISRIVDYMFLGTEGIYGIPLGVVATFVFHFVLFGLFIARTGLAQLFMDIAMALAGWSSGGPAKVAVIASGFMGSISGSSVANAVTVGSFTIPLMKRVGYKPTFAAGVEAAAGTGGQIMPPVMGAAAFIMAEFLGIPYIKIALCAVLPAFVHFFAVGWMVHLEAKKTGLLGLPREMLPNLRLVLKERWLLVGPLIIIVYLLITGSSPFLAAFWGIIFATATGQVHERTKPFLLPLFLCVPPVLFGVNPFTDVKLAIGWFGFIAASLYHFGGTSERLSTTIAVGISAFLTALLYLEVDPGLAAFWTDMLIVGAGVFYKESKMRIREILTSLEEGTKNAIAIGAACACVGFIVGATTLTGIGLKFATAVIAVAHNIAEILNPMFFGMTTVSDITLFFTLVNTALACFILGMGIPTTAQYIIAAMIAAPALLQWGIHPLLSHMFVFFYAILADVTPPVALAAYAAAGVAGSDPFKTGFRAFSLSSAKACVPFAFIYAPAVLLMPWLLDQTVEFDWLWFVQCAVTLVLGVSALGATVVGYIGGGPLNRFQRLLMGLSALLLIIPGTATDVIGAVLYAALTAWQILKYRRAGKQTTQGPPAEA
ncbi:MAG: TRAP transporter fused permease subunit [Syntrophaceae bacterium]|nr:TRAP transporter fused permease subunit [Syntrophaceae bacterium]